MRDIPRQDEMREHETVAEQGECASARMGRGLLGESFAKAQLPQTNCRSLTAKQ